MFGRTSLHENHPSREGQGQKGSKSFNNRFDFERGLWWRKNGAGGLRSTKEGLWKTTGEDGFTQTSRSCTARRMPVDEPKVLNAAGRTNDCSIRPKLNPTPSGIRDALRRIRLVHRTYGHRPGRCEQRVL